MDLTDLETFEAVARTGGITRAARELHTVQSNVTARVLQLERELGVPLFRRHSRGVTPTAAGRELLPYAVKIRALLDEARRAVAGNAEPNGTLRVGSIETTAALRLPPILAAFAAECPRVDVVLQTGTTGGLVADVLEHRLEGALVAGPVGHVDLVEEEVVVEELVLVTPPACRSLSEPVSRTGGVKVLVFRAGCTYRQRLERILAERGIAAVRRLEFGTLEGIIGCVGAGLGVTLLPRAVVEPARRDGRVAVHRLPAEQARAGTVFVRRRDAFMTGALARFLGCCRLAERRRVQ
ncbi:MAG: LysR family transcriptional regulator [Planctomycetaceae bacterium]